ncbi:hypothetical protein AA23498_0968 [Acetobacter nitrogenifigens DSM 23921 = NBRC 105050]|nr:hypothetical protein AA23498_0968 [Acetobacter nitrogenifigens DSM 23921 = NBRC 105050]
MDDDRIVAGSNLVAEQPAGRSDFQTMSGVPVVLNEDDGRSCGFGRALQSAQSFGDRVKLPVKQLLSIGRREARQNSLLKVDDKKGGFHCALIHVAIPLASGKTFSKPNRSYSRHAPPFAIRLT